MIPDDDLMAIADAVREPRTAVGHYLVCQTCSAAYGGWWIQAEMETAARVAGWTVWEGVTEGGTAERRVFCPLCCGKAAKP